MKWYTADAEVAKQQGGMLALYPRPDYAEMLAVPGFEPPEDLHVTLAYFGEDVTDMPGEAEISQAAAGVAQQFPALVAKAFGHAAFNPNGEEPCAVYLIGNSQELDDLHRQLDQVVAPFCAHEQHVPYVPHLTIGYGLSPTALSYSGDVIFDRISLQWAGQTHDFSLGE